MNTRLGTNLYRVGLVGAAISILYTMDVVWVHTSGSSILPISGRFVSREDMVATVAIGVTATLLFWGGGAAARYLVDKSAETRAAADMPREAAPPPPTTTTDSPAETPPLDPDSD